MRFSWLIALTLASACSARAPAPEAPAAEPAPEMIPVAAPEGALSLTDALKQGPDTVIAVLREQTNAHPWTELPDSLRAEPREREERVVLRSFLKKFKTWKLSKKLERGEELFAGFECGRAAETQAMAYSLEREFPEEAARTLAVRLHEKVYSCGEAGATDSLVKLTVFAIYKGDCPAAREHLARFPARIEGSLRDRLFYLRSLCPENAAPVSSAATAEPIAAIAAPVPTVPALADGPAAPGGVVASGASVVPAGQRNPWSGYGILVGEHHVPHPERPIWYLAAKSGDEEWDRLLATFMDLTGRGEHERVRALSAKLNYEKFRRLPPAFQAAVLTLMHFSGADLSVFHTLNKFIAENPRMMTDEVLGLLYPVRYWRNIVDNCGDADPLLVKSLIRQESAFNPSARSRAKAMGLMQLILPAARVFGVRRSKELFEPDTNIRVGSRYLKTLIERFGSVEAALAAYNAGPNAVRDWQERYPTENINLFVEMIPYSETREYVRLVLRNYKMYQEILREKPRDHELMNLARGGKPH